MERTPRGDTRAEPVTQFGDCRIIDLPVIRDQRGNLTFFEEESQVPFLIRRIFYLYDIPSGANRAGHALRLCHQLIIAISGSFDVVLDDGRDRQRFHLNRPQFGLHVTPLIWRELDNFSSNSVCLVVASERYSAGDYLRDYQSFLAAVADS
jgi:hypothetical protein